MSKTAQHGSGAGRADFLRDASDIAAEPRRKILDFSQLEKFPYTIEICGIPLEIERGVLSPKYFESSLLFCEMLPSVKGLRMLDMGCGCGIVGIFSAVGGASAIDAVDIAPAAVTNTRHNIQRLGLANLVRTWESDLFSDVPAQSQYDLVFWNPPWVFIESTYVYGSQLEMSIFDPGYLLLSRFLSDARSRLSSEGRVLLGFGDFGNLAELDRLANQFSYSKTEVGRRTGRTPDRFNYMLYELRPEP